MPDLPVVLHYRNDTEVTLLFVTEDAEERHVVLDRTNARDLSQMLDIWLNR
jgi:hypothetical protein